MKSGMDKRVRMFHDRRFFFINPMPEITEFAL